MPGTHGKKKKDDMQYKMGGGMMYKKGGTTKKKVKKNVAERHDQRSKLAPVQWFPNYYQERELNFQFKPIFTVRI